MNIFEHLKKSKSGPLFIMYKSLHLFISLKRKDLLDSMN